LRKEITFLILAWGGKGKGEKVEGAKRRNGEAEKVREKMGQRQAHSSKLKTGLGIGGKRKREAGKKLIAVSSWQDRI